MRPVRSGRPARPRSTEADGGRDGRYVSRGDRGDRIFVLPGFLTPSECEAMIARGEAIGFEPATVNGEPIPEWRNNASVPPDDPEPADRLRLRRCLARTRQLSSRNCPIE